MANDKAQRTAQAEAQINAALAGEQPSEAPPADTAPPAADTAVFKVTRGYPLYDHSQGVVVTSEGVVAKLTPWMETQLEAGLVTVVG